MAIKAEVHTPRKGVSILTHPRRIPATYRAAVGSVFHQWSLLEMCVELICWRLLGLPKKEGRLVFSHLGFGDKIRIYRALVDKLYPTRAERADAIVVGKNLEKLSAKRNEIAHGRWGRNVESRPRSVALSLYVTRGSAENRILPRAQTYSSKEVNAIADEIEAAALCARKAFRGLDAHDSEANRLKI